MGRLEPAAIQSRLNPYRSLPGNQAFSSRYFNHVFVSIGLLSTLVEPFCFFYYDGSNW